MLVATAFRWKGGRADGWTDRQTHRVTDGWAEGWTDRITDNSNYRVAHSGLERRWHHGGLAGTRMDMDGWSGNVWTDGGQTDRRKKK